ncbi:hypothetical protein [Streptomyces sp. NPDC060022]|uniref:hypothetical protein n=1 Tax=Streptomyces sp. NPDC060022 TaxID=3347039 RepID=UPI0036C5A668
MTHPLRRRRGRVPLRHRPRRHRAPHGLKTGATGYRRRPAREAGKRFGFTLTTSRQAGFTGDKDIAGAKVSASYDDGATWRDAGVRVGDEVWDDAGNRTTQTIKRAYALDRPYGRTRARALRPWAVSGVVATRFRVDQAASIVQALGWGFPAERFAW